MKQFEKWKNKNCDNKGCPHEASCNNCEHIWRAALEWSKEVIRKNYLKEHIGVSEGTQYTNTGGLDSLSALKDELEGR